MTLEDRLERLANRTPLGDPADVIDAARARAESRPESRSPRFLAAAAAVVAVVALAVGGLALTGGDDNDSVTLAGPDGDPVQPQPPCEDITRFADSLDDTGITYDYAASLSPGDLAERSDAVLAGTLTGTVTQATDPEFGEEYIGFEVQVSEHYKTDGERAGDTLTVFLSVGTPSRAGQWAGLVPSGAPVVVFAYSPAGSTPGPGPSVVANPVQGIVTACDDGPPIGLVSTQGDWPSFATLADIEAALTPPPGDQADERGGVDGPVIYGSSSPVDAKEQPILTGQVLYQGDCLYLRRTAAEATYPWLPIIWPHGTVWQDRPEGVRPPDGTFVPVGESGAWVSDDLFLDAEHLEVSAATDVRSVDALALSDLNPDALDRARECDVDDARHVAYVGAVTVRAAGTGAVEGDTAVWDVDAAAPPVPSARSVTVLVTRLGCSGGETGKVLEPAVSADAEQVVVTFSVEPLPNDAYPCPGNDSVPYVIELGEPLGDRELVDGACLSGEAVSTSFCSEGAVRWPPPA